MYIYLLKYSESIAFQYPIIFLTSFLIFRVSIVMGHHVSNICIFYVSFKFITPPRNNTE